MRIEEQCCADRLQASSAAADVLAAGLRRQLALESSARLLVSGGSTPVRCFDILSQTVLDWERVCITLSDERWVPPTDPNSNEGMLRRHLLTGRAARARFLPLYRPDVTVAQACVSVDEELRATDRKFTCTLLGMGEDGHFASLFPDAQNLARGLDPHAVETCLPIATNASPVSRISLTLSALLNTQGIALLFFGAKKRAVYRAAKNGDARYPVFHLLNQPCVDIHAIWSP